MPGIGFVISSLQFPSRWMVPATALTAFFAAFFLLELKGEKNRILRAAVGVIGCITIFSSVYHVNSIAYLNKAYFVYNDMNFGTTGVGNGEYLLEGTTASDYYYHKPVADSGLEWSNYEKEGTTISISLNNTLNETAYLELPLIGYRGYSCKAEQEADEMPYIAEERGEHGDLRIAVPAGYQGSVNVSYTGFALFHAAEALSGAGILILAAWGIYCLKKERTRQVRCR
jgi:hypothetical protein